MVTTMLDARPRFDAATCSARRALYRFTSLALLDPLSGTWSRLADERSQACVSSACELLREQPAAVASCFGLGELSLDRLDPVAMFARRPTSSEALNDEYKRTFGLLVTAACPPYETEYTDGKLSFQRSQHLADIAGFYRAFGMEPQAERPDHVALELEFLALLIDLESRAESDDQFLVSREAQTHFVGNHLAWWIPSFARLLLKEAPESFFAAVGELLCAFLPAERSRLGVEPPLNPTRPSQIERPEECEGCVLQSL